MLNIVKAILLADTVGPYQLVLHHVKSIIWVCLKMGYTPNYSHLVGIMIINHWV